MSVRFQCNRCQEKIELDEKLVGRKVACPMCETRLVVPEPDDEPLFVEQDIRLALEYFKLSAWDKAFARKALENGFVGPDSLHEAVTKVRRAMQKGQKLTIDQYLLSREAITPQKALITKKLVKALPGSAELAGEALAECPNCFETIRANATECPYCAQRIGDLTVSAMCPACKREQASGRKYCISCGADMETGLRPGVREKVARTDSARRLKEWLANHSLGIAAALVAVVAVIAWTKRADIGRAIHLTPTLEEADRAGLEARLRRFDDALRHGDMDIMAKMLDPKLPKRKRKADERLRSVILGFGQPVQQVLSVGHDEIRFAEDGHSAAVHTEIGGALGGGVGLSTKVLWKWVEREGEWYYAGPLP